MKDKIELTYEAFERWFREHIHGLMPIDSHWKSLCAEAEKPEKKKALAYVSAYGLLYYGVEGSEVQKDMEKSNTYKHAPEFDIESREV